MAATEDDNGGLKDDKCGSVEQLIDSTEQAVKQTATKRGGKGSAM